LSRLDVFQLNATNEEILDLMRTLAEKGYGTVARDVPAGRGLHRPVGHRAAVVAALYEPSLKKVQYALENDIDWRELVHCQLQQLGQKESMAPADSRRS
jgi:hypothetical protein